MKVLDVSSYLVNIIVFSTVAASSAVNPAVSAFGFVADAYREQHYRQLPMKAVPQEGPAPPSP